MVSKTITSMSLAADAKNLLGLLFHGAVYSICTVSDVATAGATKELGITPLLKSLGQNISGSMASEHFKEIFNVRRMEQQLKSKKPGDINHDLENLFKASALTAIGYIKLLLEAEMKDMPEGITITEKKAIRQHLEGASVYLGQQLKFLKGNSMATVVKYDDIDDSSNYLERLSSHVLFYRDELPAEAREKLLSIYTTQLPYCFHLAFHEALKDEKNIKGFKAFQLRYMEESKELLKGNAEMLMVIDEKLERLQAGESLVDQKVVEELFVNVLKNAMGFFSEEFDGVKELLGKQHAEVMGKLEVVERKVDFLSQTIPQLIELNEQKDNEIKQLRQQLEEKPDARLERVLAKLLVEKDEVQQELQKSDELVKQQAKDKADLEKQLSSYKGNDELKAKAFEEVEKGNYDEAESYLKESAKDQIKATAETFYELGKVNKLKLNYREALHYFDLAVKIDGENEGYLYEASLLSGTLGYYDDETRYLKKLIDATDENDSAIGTYLNNLGLAYNNKGEYDKAIGYYEKALIADKKQYGEEHSNIATYYNNLGLAYEHKGEYDKAISYYEKALNIWTKNYEEGHPKLATTYNNLGASNDSKGEYDKAISYYEKALTINTKFYGTKHPDIARDYNNLGVTYYNKGEYDKAISFYQKALTVDKKFFGEEHPQIAIRYNNLGASYMKKDEYDKAISYYEKALVIDKKFYGEEHPQIGIRYNNLGLAYDNKREYDKAISYYEKALVIDKKFYGEEHLSVAIRYNNLGLAYYHKGEYDKAIDYYQKTLAIYNKFLPPAHSYIIIAQKNLAAAIASKEKQ